MPAQEAGLISRILRYLSRFFASPPASITAAPVTNSFAPPTVSRPTAQSSPSASVSTSAPSAPVNQAGSKAEMHTTITRLAQELVKVNPHTRLIKFIGARQPRPHFDRSSLPPLVLTSSSGDGSAHTAVSTQKASSIGPVGSTPRGSGIDESQLPAFLRRRMPDSDEITAINLGGSYRL